MLRLSTEILRTLLIHRRGRHRQAHTSDWDNEVATVEMARVASRPPGPAGGVGGPSAEADGFLSAFPDDDALEEALFGPSPVRDELDDLLEFRGAAVPPCAPAAPPDTPPRAPAASGLPSGLPPALPEPSEVAAASQISDEMTLTALAASVRASAVADTHMSVAVAEIAVADSAMAVTDIVVYHSAVADTDIVAVDSTLAEKAIVQLAR